MKKVVLRSLVVVALVGVVTFNASINSHRESLSDLTLANIEALAQNEGNGGNTTKCETCCDLNCTDCLVGQNEIRCLSKPSCYVARFTVNTCKIK